MVHIHRYYCQDCDRVSKWYKDFKKCERYGMIHMHSYSHMIGFQAADSNASEPEVPGVLGDREREDYEEIKWD